MKSSGSKRATAALVLAAVAVFFSLNGVGAAKSVVRLLDGKQIKKKSIQLDRLNPKAIEALRGQAGPQGVKGETGAVGATGPRGETGAKGAAGADGLDGKDGSDGSDGKDGIDGVDGTNGSDASSAVFARINGAPQSTNLLSYGSPSGTSTAVPGTNAIQMVTPAVPTTARDMQVRLSTPPGAGASRRITLVWSNGVGHNGVIGCTVVGTANSCSTNGSTTMEPNAPLWINTDGNFGTTPAAGTDIYVTWRATG
jgi:Collagen triple helix repeat (20 copies)